MKKKIISVVSLIILILCFCSCEKDQIPQNTAPDQIATRAAMVNDFS